MITHLVMGKIFYKNEMWIQTFCEIATGYSTSVTNFPKTGWKLGKDNLLHIFH